MRMNKLPKFIPMKSFRHASPSISLLAACLFAPVCGARAASLIERILPADPSGSVILQGRPDPTVIAWAVEEQLPPSATGLDISHGGTFDPYTGKVKWGPYTDALPRDLSYRIGLPQSGDVVLSGKVSWDGAAPLAVAGEDSFSVTGDGGFRDWLASLFGAEVLNRPDGQPGFDGDADALSLIAEYYFGLDPATPDASPITLQVDAQNRLSIGFVRRTSASGLASGFWHSADLLDWALLDPGPPEILSTEGPLETVRFSMGILPAPAFIRLQLDY